MATHQPTTITTKDVYKNSRCCPSGEHFPSATGVITSTNTAYLADISTYDENGNMTFYSGKNFVWDANNRLTHVYNMEEPSQVARYYYSAMNQRVMKHFDSDEDGLLDDKTVYIYCHQSTMFQR